MSFKPPTTSTSAQNPMSLLKSGSGTSASTNPVNLDTVAISGLTSLDTLKIFYTVEAVDQTLIDEIVLYNDTDSLVLLDEIGQSAGAGGFHEATLRQLQSSVKRVFAMKYYAAGTADDIFGETQDLTFTTDWTGSWTLALRNTGLDAGSFTWSWAVYKIAGQ